MTRIESSQTHDQCTSSRVMNLYQTFNVEGLPTKSPGTVKLDALYKKLVDLDTVADINRKQMMIALILYYAKEHDGYVLDAHPLPYGLERITLSDVAVDLNQLPIPLQWMLCRFVDMSV